MKFSTAVGFIVALASSALASPAPAVTAAPRAPAAGDEGGKCSKYDTTTSYHHNFCPMYCVEPDSPECPLVNCLMTVISCKPGETITHPPLPAPTSVTATVTGKDCTITKEADVGCVLCGCVGCPECAPIKTKAP
ncbi:hypothetical protein C7999DRAFT_33898 [Corynascus novoguineensis]|uniref:Uncharacterized protein n=1 Tax=Corynascus novoguineensis TaxID=1126955 RepID=A0AAN7CPY5_9PEZI|nr:hypothetical protein C7999DRAFT_33898 [Corynascus novoguineensis]